MYRSTPVCRISGDIIFAVDASGSVGKANFQKLMDAVLQTVLMLDLSTSVGNAGARVSIRDDLRQILILGIL